MRCSDGAIFQTSVIVSNFFRRLLCALFLPGQTLAGHPVRPINGGSLGEPYSDDPAYPPQWSPSAVVLVRPHMQCQGIFRRTQLFFDSSFCMSIALAVPRQPPRNISNDKVGLTLSRLGDRSGLITTLNFQAVFYASVSALPRARKTISLTAQELFHSCYTA
jgi:hypothetical protein